MAEGQDTGGRKLSARAESTRQWEKFAHHCLTGGLEKFQREMGKLEGKDYVQSFLMMLKFVKPQFAAVTLTGEEGKQLVQPIINVIQLPGQPPMVLRQPQINLQGHQPITDVESEPPTDLENDGVPNNQNNQTNEQQDQL